MKAMVYDILAGKKIRKECICKIRIIMKNRITAMNTLAMPVGTYSFNVVNWHLKELKKLDTKKENNELAISCTTRNQKLTVYTYLEVMEAGE